MKKQLLTITLGLSSILFPLGSNMEDTNPTSTKNSSPEDKTGLQISDTSNIQVFDIDKSGGVSFQDQLAVITINFLYDKNLNEGYSITKDSKFHVYEQEKYSKEIFSLTVDQLLPFGKNITEEGENPQAFILQLKYEDYQDFKIWNYRIENENDFKITLDTTFFTSPNENKEITIGFVEINEEVAHYPFNYWIYTDGKVKNISPKSSSLDYEIMFKEDNVLNPDDKVENVKWIDPNDIDGDGNKEIASTSNDYNGTLIAEELNLYETYKDTYIIAEMSDGKSTNKVIIDDFTTESQQVSTEIISTGEIYDLTNTSASIDYQIKPGIDHYGKQVDVLNVKWIDKNEKVLATNNKEEGTLEATGLSSHTKYNNTKIIVEVTDKNSPKPKEVNNFSTKFSLNKILIIDESAILVVLLAWLVIVGFVIF